MPFKISSRCKYYKYENEKWNYLTGYIHLRKHGENGRAASTNIIDILTCKISKSYEM